MIVICKHWPSLSVRDIPSWVSCHMPDSSSAVWSMAVSEAEAVRAMILAMSIQVQSVNIIDLYNDYNPPFEGHVGSHTANARSASPHFGAHSPHSLHSDAADASWMGPVPCAHTGLPQEEHR